ncbi:MAG: radical SAM protein [Polyangiaceae bacterium]
MVDPTRDVPASDVVSAQLRNRLRVLGHLDLARATLEQISSAAEPTEPRPVALVELHATDACDLDCVFCTYQDRDTTSFPYDALDRIVPLQPRAVVIAGGGEPTLYRSGERTFSDLVLRLAELLPQAKLGLVSNGVLYPGDEAARRLAWARVSLDAATQQVHSLTKRDRQPTFVRRVDNVLAYLAAGVPHVGVGFVYHRYNFHEAAETVFLVHDEVTRRMKGFLERVNLQFRPTCGIESCECPSENYSAEKDRLLTPDLTPSWADERRRQTALLTERMDRDPGFRSFVETQTNFLSREVHEPVPKVGAFHQCTLALLRVLLRADGTMYPCVMKASQRHAPVANLLVDNAAQILAGMRRYFELREGACRGQRDCCNIDGVKNVYLEEALEGALSGLPVPDSDPFF